MFIEVDQKVRLCKTCWLQQLPLLVPHLRPLFVARLKCCSSVFYLCRLQRPWASPVIKCISRAECQSAIRACFPKQLRRIQHGVHASPSKPLSRHRLLVGVGNYVTCCVLQVARQPFQHAVAASGHKLVLVGLASFLFGLTVPLQKLQSLCVDLVLLQGRCGSEQTISCRAEHLSNKVKASLPHSLQRPKPWIGSTGVVKVSLVEQR